MDTIFKNILKDKDKTQIPVIAVIATTLKVSTSTI